MANVSVASVSRALNGHSGVTAETQKRIRDVATRLNIGTVLLHLGAVRFRYLSGWFRYTMDAREGVELLDLVEPTNVVPVHYEGWSHFQQGRDVAEKVLASSAHAVTWLDPGESTTVDA